MVPTSRIAHTERRSPAGEVAWLQNTDNAGNIALGGFGLFRTEEGAVHKYDKVNGPK